MPKFRITSRQRSLFFERVRIFFSELLLKIMAAHRMMPLKIFSIHESCEKERDEIRWHYFHGKTTDKVFQFRVGSITMATLHRRFRVTVRRWHRWIQVKAKYIFLSQLVMTALVLLRGDADTERVMSWLKKSSQGTGTGYKTHSSTDYSRQTLTCCPET